MKQRVRSPRAPATSLKSAVERVLAVFEKGGLHAMPRAVVAKMLGYSSDKTGTAARTLATLTMYGLLEKRPQNKLAVSPKVKRFKYAPEDKMKREIVEEWLTNPQPFEHLLTKFDGELPADSMLLYELSEAGFTSEDTAKNVIQALRESVDYVASFVVEDEYPEEEEEPPLQSEVEVAKEIPAQVSPSAGGIELRSTAPTVTVQDSESELRVDRIPVRLPGRRRAWLEIPVPFYEADKDILKQQIELLVTDDEEDVDG